MERASQSASPLLNPVYSAPQAARRHYSNTGAPKSDAAAKRVALHNITVVLIEYNMMRENLDPSSMPCDGVHHTHTRDYDPCPPRAGVYVKRNVPQRDWPGKAGLD
jgi:hypothetical protein